MMKYCPNYKCVAYGRVVYSQATRCAFCRWDLKPPRMKSELAEATDGMFHPTHDAHASTTDASGEDRPQPRAKASATSLRRIA